MTAEVPSSVVVKAEQPEPESEVQQAAVDDSAYEFLGFLEEEPADECTSSSAAPSTASTKCPYCGIVFPSNFSLKLHLAVIHTDECTSSTGAQSTASTTCPYCGTACLTDFVLKHHLTVNHTYDIYSGKLLKCTFCKVLKPGHAFIRNRSVASFTTTCVVCLNAAELRARRNREVTRNLEKHARQGPVERTNLSLKCPNCEFETSSKSYLFQHLAVAHSRVQLSRVKRFMRCGKCKHSQPGENYVHFDEDARAFFIADVCMRCSVSQGAALRCWKYSVPSVPSESRGTQHAGIIDLRRGNVEVVNMTKMN